MVGATEIEGARDIVALLARDLEALELPLHEAETALAHVISMKNCASTMEALLAKRIADTRAWERAGAKSAAEHLANKSGTTVGRAKDALSPADTLGRHAATDEAARNGDLSPEQAAAVSGAADADPSAEGRLLDKAKGGGSLGELRDECEKVKAAADADPDETYKRNRASRMLRIYKGAGGITKIFGTTTPDQMARIRLAVETRADELFEQARRSGNREPREAYLMDALDQICTEWLEGSSAMDGCEAGDDARDDDGGEPQAGSATEAGSATDRGEPARSAKHRRSLRWLGMIRLDHAALVRGWVEGDEMCEIAGLGPIPVRVARELLGDSLLYLLVTKGSAVATTVNIKRGPNQAQRIALLWQQGLECEVEGCASCFVQIDHTRPWTETKHTVLDELGHKCTYHHWLKTALGWDLVPGAGKRPMVPPDDPRHPKHARSGEDPPDEDRAA